MSTVTSLLLAGAYCESQSGAIKMEVVNHMHALFFFLDKMMIDMPEQNQRLDHLRFE